MKEGLILFVIVVFLILLTIGTVLFDFIILKKIFEWLGLDLILIIGATLIIGVVLWPLVDKWSK